MNLFSERNLWTMLHGVVLGGGALLGLAAALFALWSRAGDLTARETRNLALLLAGVAGLVWLTVLVGTYAVFPPYRVTPPAGATDLTAYPRALLLSQPGTAWLHGFGMETKEHLPWIVAMLSTAAAVVAGRHGALLRQDAGLRRVVTLLVGVSFVLVSWLSLLGMWVNKVAPLE